MSRFCPPMPRKPRRTCPTESSWGTTQVAVLEGMALGTPVLAFDVGGIGEAVEDGRSGTLVPPVDVDALARAMVRYLRDPERRRAEGRAARATVEARFGAPAHARVIEEALRAAAGRTG